MDLFDDQDGPPGINVAVNDDYAKRYEERKKKEEYSRLKQKERAGEIAQDEESSESSSESEDEDARLLTPDVHDRFLELVPLLRKRDPLVYKKDVDFFEKKEETKENAKEKSKKAKEDETQAKEKKKSKKKPKYLKDVLREHILEKADKGSWSDSDSENEGPSSRKKGLSHVEEQQKLLSDFHQAVHNMDQEKNQEDGDDLFVAKPKTPAQIEEENRLLEKLEKEYKHKKLTKPSKKDAMAAIAEFWNSEQNVSKEEKFLREYILKEQWRENLQRDVLRPLDEADEEDEQIVDEADRFEADYNFRHQEEDASLVKTYSRNVESIRKPKSSRKDARKRRRERKELEKRQKAEELKRLKNLKKEEISKKMEAILKISGAKKLGGEIDLESDFDPEKYEKTMEKIFNDQYYDEEDDDADLKKPTFSDEEYNVLDDDETQYENEKPTLASQVKKKEMDVNTAIELAERDVKAEKSLEKYLEEYYQLDYEDLIAGEIPCRFSYKKVPANDFGMRPKDVLVNDDKTLNRFVGLKRLAPYRNYEYTPRSAFHNWIQYERAKQRRREERVASIAKEQKKEKQSKRKRKHNRGLSQAKDEEEGLAIASEVVTSFDTQSKPDTRRKPKHRSENEEESSGIQKSSKKRGKRSKVKLSKKDRKRKRKDSQGSNKKVREK